MMKVRLKPNTTIDVKPDATTKQTCPPPPQASARPAEALSIKSEGGKVCTTTHVRQHTCVEGHSEGTPSVAIKESTITYTRQRCGSCIDRDPAREILDVLRRHALRTMTMLRCHADTK